MSDREKLIELLVDAGYEWDAYLDHCYESEEEPHLTYYDFMVDGLIANGVTVQKHERWIRYPHGSGIYCSNCKRKRRYKDERDNYCPNCGARMVKHD